ncbi:unnamed protein product, partial [Ixodes hexagonus]
LFFEDGKRSIDFVLAFGKGDSIVGEDARKIFEQNLVIAGLALEHVEGQEFADKKTYFVKIHAPWKVLTKYAEILHLMMPVKVAMHVFNDFLSEGALAARKAAKAKHGWLQMLCARFCTPCPYSRQLIPDEEEFHTAEFSRQRERAFLKNLFRTPLRGALRNRVILSTATIKQDCLRLNVIRLEVRRTLDISTLNVGPCGTGAINRRVEAPNERRLLYSEWARLAVCYKEQPINLIRRYFGVKTGLYFTWLGFYTSMLVLPAIVGIITTVYGFLLLPANVPVSVRHFENTQRAKSKRRNEAHDNVPSECVRHVLSVQIVYLFENPATVAFSIFIALWATVFMELWKRRQAVLKWEWKLSDLDTLSNVVKPEYEARARVYRLNPVTLNYEPYVPLWERILRISCTASVVILMLSLAFCAMFAIIAYRIIMMGLLLRDKHLRPLAPLTTAITASTLDLIVILVMNKMYARIALWLTYIEMPRTEEEYEDSYTIKMFLFNFFNTYSSLVYIAFFKGR